MTDATNALLPCPFCGWSPPADDDSLLDVLYPTGSWWALREFYGTKRITFRSQREREPGDKPCWGMHCTENIGGCGVKVTALTKEEVIAKWNRRQPTASAGMVVVPREPTLDMCGAACSELYVNPDEPDEEARRVWKAMLSAHESQSPTEYETLMTASRRVVSWLDDSSLDTSHLPNGMGRDIRGLRDVILVQYYGIAPKSPNADTTPDVSERGPTDNAEGE